MGNWRFLFTVPFLVAGCAAQNEYIKPETGKPTYSAGDAKKAPGDLMMVARSRDAVWRQIITGAEKAGFMIEGADQSSWTMQLRYTGDPKDYITCGRVLSKVKTARGERNYDFSAAKAYQQYELQQGDKLYLVDRRMNLDVRATLVLEVVSGSGTRLKLEPNYTATRDQSVQGGGRKPFGVTDKVSFRGSDSATFPNAATRCQATGDFERDVLALAKR